MQARFSAPERSKLEKMINEREPLTLIAETLGKHPTSVAREVKRNRSKCSPIKFSKFTRIRCAKAKDNGCKLRGICGSQKCKRLCVHCTYIVCAGRCSAYVERICTDTASWPYVCNRCKEFSTCPEQRYIYEGSRAQRIASLRASLSRRGIDLDATELSRLDDLITPLVLKGQSLFHVWNNHRDEIGLSLATLYRYLNLGLFSAKRINLPRAVHFRPRTESKDTIQKREEIGRRTYRDYLGYLTGNDYE